MHEFRTGRLHFAYAIPFAQRSGRTSRDFSFHPLRDGVSSCLHVQTMAYWPTCKWVLIRISLNLHCFTRTNDGGLRVYRGHQDAAGIWISQNPSIRPTFPTRTAFPYPRPPDQRHLE